MNRKLYGRLVFEISRPGRSAFRLPKSGVPVVGNTAAAPIDSGLLRTEPLDLPECDEPSLVRHYNNMSTNNFGVDTRFYP
ncbi:MAG: aminomethyl-transferring glycine dehydrogenase subunit GcvPB, partial [Muribaculaceae bacterium]|nr:aminomethyl-transferring glycine dehydrogenase subunit GcvPB [Muribaculaceae bacterium]